jgi:hypothetical protein
MRLVPPHSRASFATSRSVADQPNSNWQLFVDALLMAKVYE